MSAEDRKYMESPSVLVAIIRAAKLAGDRELMQAGLRELKERFNIDLKFGSDLQARGGRNDK